MYCCATRPGGLGPLGIKYLCKTTPLKNVVWRLLTKGLILYRYKLGVINRNCSCNVLMAYFIFVSKSVLYSYLSWYLCNVSNVYVKRLKTAQQIFEALVSVFKFYTI